MNKTSEQDNGFVPRQILIWKCAKPSESVRSAVKTQQQVFTTRDRVQNVLRVQNAMSWVSIFVVGAHFRGCVWLENFVSVSSTSLYADDALLYSILSSAGSDAGHRLFQDGILSASSWASSWQGRFSPQKTVVMQIGTTCTATTANEFTLENQLVESVPNHKHLGLVISSDLTWDEHLKGIMSRASQRIGLLKQMSRYLPPNTTAKLYLYYVRPCFEYASPVWHGATPASAAQSLERLQASMARTILRAEWSTPKKELLAALQWPSLRWRRAIASLTLFHRLKNSPTPVASSCLPAPFASDNSRSRRRQHQIRLPSTRSTRYTRSFFFHSALLWNTLPNSIQSHSSTSSFQHALEEHWHAYKYLTDTDIPLPPV